MNKIADFRSDTVTKPTERMKSAMMKAELGDDVFGDDPTVQKLEKLSAEKVGKEAGLFVPSGTMGNCIAVRVHTKEGDEVIVETLSHIYNLEVAHLSMISRVPPRQARFCSVLRQAGWSLPYHWCMEVLFISVPGTATCMRSQ
ncbi:MAG: beta-eliminating lyase-related protein [Candidatus Aenigmatarchaeota archaeon]